MKKIAFFDFDETLVNFQTADSFVDFVRNKTNRERDKKLEFIRKALHKLKFFSVLGLFFPSNLHKRLKLYQLKGFDENSVQEFARLYYQEIIQKNWINEVLEELKKCKKEGYDIVIVSGGYSVYIRYFLEQFDVKYVLATNIAFDRGICLGKFSGVDCMNNDKIPRIKEVIDLSEYDLENSIAFSDSVTDLPLLNLVGNSIVVSKKSPQKWAEKYNFNEIIWNNKL